VSDDATCWLLASIVLVLILVLCVLLWLGREPKAPKPEGKHGKRRDPYPPAHGLKSPRERWLYGDDLTNNHDKESEG
jgi:hypothetical protein